MGENDITVLIPVHYRQNYVEELVEYLLENDVEVIVGDSSSNSIDSLVELSNQDDRLQYHFLNGVFYYEKLYRLAQLVSTKYVVFCADDDFVSVPALRKMAESLDSANGCESSVGVICEPTNPSESAGETFALHHTSRNLLKHVMPNETYRHAVDCGLARLSVNHGLYTADLFCRISKFRIGNEWSWPVKIGDQFWSFFTLLSGGSIPELFPYLIRDVTDSRLFNTLAEYPKEMRRSVAAREFFNLVRANIDSVVDWSREHGAVSYTEAEILTLANVIASNAYLRRPFDLEEDLDEVRRNMIREGEIAEHFALGISMLSRRAGW